MIRWTASLIALLSASVAVAWPCGGPSDFDLHLQVAGRAFVGTVVGYRLDDTTLVADLPYCPVGSNSEQASDLCIEFWTSVVSIQFEVAIPIKGIAGHRKYEVATWNGDGCAPQVGEMWLTSGWHLDGFSMVLESRPTQHQIELWRAIATAEPDN